MFRNQYDTDVTTFSPVGRLHQVEYAMEAVKQGSVLAGLTNSRYAVLAAIRRSASELASHQKKIYKIDDHLAAGISGLIADGRVLAEYMREEALNHRFAYDSPIDSGRLVTQISDKSQVYTQTTEKRPYGVGLLVIGMDKTGPHLWETSPSAVHFEYTAQAIGARSQSARTYLERNYESFEQCSLEQLIVHALCAIKASAHEGKLTPDGVSLAFVGEGQELTMLSGESLAPYFALLEEQQQ